MDESGSFVSSAQEGSTVGLVLNRTCFYSEGGGQVADQGEIRTAKVRLSGFYFSLVKFRGFKRHQGARLKVIDVQKTQNYVLHTCEVLNGEISVGESVTLDIDQVLWN